MKLHLALIALVAGLAVCLPAGCDEKIEVDRAGASPPPPPAADVPPVRTYDYSQKVVASAKRAAGQRWAVAILRFGDTREVEDQPFGAASQPAQDGGKVNVNVKVVGVEGTPVPNEVAPQINKRGREILKHSLVKSEAFTVIERERILDILREINFGKTKYVDPDTAAEEGNLLAVRYIIEGSIGLNEDRTLKDTLDKDADYRDADIQPGFMDNVFNRGKVDQQKRMMALNQLRQQRSKERARARFDTSCYLSVYDVQTGQVVTTVMGLGTNGLEAIDDAVEEVISELSAIDKDARVVAAVGDGKVFLDRGKGSVKVGERYQVIHLGAPIRDRNGQVIGHDETEVGEIEIIEVRELLSVARAVGKAGEIVRGDMVRPAKH